MRALLERGSVGLLGTAWLWLAMLVAAAGAGWPVSRPALEAAGLALGAGVVFRAAVHRPVLGPLRALSLPGLVVPVVVAAATYAWSLTLGPLSDDYLLRQWALSGEWLPDAWPFRRPVPLAIWQGLGLVGGWELIHALNVAAHAANSGLVAALAGGWLGPGAALAAGLTFAMFPASAEAVAWSAGVFDVVATTMVLAAVLAWQRMRPGALRTAVVVAAGVIGFATKETAVVIPALLVAVAAVSVGNWMAIRQHAPALIVTGAVMAGALLVRTAGSSAVAGHLAALPASRRQWKDLLVEPFAGVAMPMRVEHGAGVAAALLATATLILVAVALWPSLTSAPRKTSDHAAPVFFVGFVWVLIAALPLLSTFHVAPTFEGSRYLYLPAAGFSLALSAAFGTDSSAGRKVGAAALVTLLAIYAWRLQGERAVWQSAAATRDVVLAEAQRVIDQAGCATLTVLDPPDAADGAFVFRNGLDVALRGLQVTPTGPRCTARWDAATRRLSAVSGSE